MGGYTLSCIFINFYHFNFSLSLFLFTVPICFALWILSSFHRALISFPSANYSITSPHYQVTYIHDIVRYRSTIPTENTHTHTPPHLIHPTSPHEVKGKQLSCKMLVAGTQDGSEHSYSPFCLFSLIRLMCKQQNETYNMNQVHISLLTCRVEQ